MKFRVRYEGQICVDKFWLAPDGELYVEGVCCQEFDLVPVDMQDYTIERATGTKDTLNREIYEGDFVKVTSEVLTGAHKYENGQIKWMNEGFYICEPWQGATMLKEYVFCDCCPSCLEIKQNNDK